MPSFQTLGLLKIKEVQSNKLFSRALCQLWHYAASRPACSLFFICETWRNLHK